MLQLCLGLDRERFIKELFFCQDNIQILRDLSLLQIQMRDLEGFRVSLFFHFLLVVKMICQPKLALNDLKYDFDNR